MNSTTLALPAIAVVGSWQGIGQAMIMFLAGLILIFLVFQRHFVDGLVLTRGVD